MQRRLNPPTSAPSTKSISKWPNRHQPSARFSTQPTALAPTSSATRRPVQGVVSANSLTYWVAIAAFAVLLPNRVIAHGSQYRYRALLSPTNTMAGCSGASFWTCLPSRGGRQRWCRRRRRSTIAPISAATSSRANSKGDDQGNLSSK